MSADDNTVPQLEAYLPDGGADVGVSDDHDSVAVFLDIPDGTGFIELSFSEAVNLSRALLGAIEKITDRRETQLIAASMRVHQQETINRLLSEIDDCSEGER